MSITPLAWSANEAIDNMARVSAKHLDVEKIDSLVHQLKQTAHDADEFNAIVSAITNDKSFTVAEVIELSRRFAGGPKSKTRKAAITALGQERLRLSHGEAKAATAAKSRTW